MSKEIIARALDWLEANPDNHIEGDFARTKVGGPSVPPTDPRATCFCALGRIAKEADIVERFDDTEDIVPAPFRGTQKFFDNLGISVITTEVYEINDGIGLENMRLTKPERIAKLRELLLNEGE